MNIGHFGGSIAALGSVLTPERRRPFFKACDALGMIVLFIFDSRQSRDDVLELSLNRSGYNRVESSEKGGVCADDCGDRLPKLNIVHMFSYRLATD